MYVFYCVVDEWDLFFVYVFVEQVVGLEVVQVVNYDINVFKDFIDVFCSEFVCVGFYFYVGVEVFEFLFCGFWF